MSYYYNAIIKNKSFEEVTELVKSSLQDAGFGIPAEVNMTDIFKNKLDVEFRKYVILGACSPRSALQAVQSEKNIGVLLPCSVIIQDHENGDIEVAAVNPISAMMAVDNNTVQSIAMEIAHKLEAVVTDVGQTR